MHAQGHLLVILQSTNREIRMETVGGMIVVISWSVLESLLFVFSFSSCVYTFVIGIVYDRSDSIKCTKT